MPQTNEEIVEANRSQSVGETDSFTPERYRQFFGHFPHNSRTVLDVGCSTGRGGTSLKSLDPNLEITGFDCLPERIESLDKEIYAHGLVGFSSAIPARDGTFDVVVGGEFIEHLPPGEVDKVLVEFFRVIRLRGRLLLTTPNPNYLKNKFKNLSVLLEPSHLSQHFADALRLRMQLAGFSRVRIFGSGRATKYLGERLPILSCYGSYLIQGDKW
jgi:2-polyprenyl-3-methyl-5-hydroxy-6-metoxy-1,4-benzoquinol methylase